MTLTIFLIIFIIFRGVSLRLIDINDSKVLDKYVFISILIMVSIVPLSFVFFGWPITFWISEVYILNP